MVSSQETPLLGYGTLNSDATPHAKLRTNKVPLGTAISVRLRH
jgi:hypothetical protein